jgi:hypothetical protein
MSLDYFLNKIDPYGEKSAESGKDNQTEIGNDVLRIVLH